MGSRKVSMRATRWGGKIFRLLLSTDNNDAGTLYAVWTKQTSSRHSASKREGYDRTPATLNLKDGTRLGNAPKVKPKTVTDSTLCFYGVDYAGCYARDLQRMGC